MIVALNGPPGIGKSTLAEALSEGIPQCVMLDGDHLIVANPRFRDELEHLHSTVAILVSHHRRFGCEHFVITHIWASPEALADLRDRLADEDEDFRCFLLTLPFEENMLRIQRRASSRRTRARGTHGRSRAPSIGGESATRPRCAVRCVGTSAGARCENASRVAARNCSKPLWPASGAMLAR